MLNKSLFVLLALVSFNASALTFSTEISPKITPPPECRGCTINTPQDNNGSQCPSAGNPINLGSGNKFQSFSIELNNSLSIDLFYNSFRTFETGPGWNNISKNVMGSGWSAKFDVHASPIALQNYDINSSKWSVGLTTSDGRAIYFTKYKSQGILGEWVRVNAEFTEKVKLVRSQNEWKMYHEDGSVAVYRLVDYAPPSGSEPYFHPELKRGIISEFIDATGNKTYYSNSNSNISGFYNNRISGDSAQASDRQFAIDYNSSGRVAKIRDLKNLGREWVLNYVKGNLTSINYPDGTSTIFHYDDNNSRSDSFLTGITDRRGIRFSTYTYESHGLAGTSELNGGVNKVTVEYFNIANEPGFFRRQVTDSLNRVTNYYIEKKGGHLFKVDSVVGPGCSTCSNTNSSYEYDAYNNITNKVIDGVTTDYSIPTNAQPYGQYTSKTIAAGTSVEKQISYTWDSVFHRKIKTITEPSVYSGHFKTTEFTYNDDGKTTEVKIQGFQPDGTAISRTTNTYYDGPNGQISSIDGPKAGALDSTTFEYHPANDPVVVNRNRLKRVIGPEGIIERENIQWSSGGNVVSEDRPNGITIVNTYYPMTQRLNTMSLSNGSKTVVTKYEYLATGQVEKITSNYGTPEATSMTLEYDGALRLRKIEDSVGNYREYVLDTQGNLKEEKVFDTNNVLKKIISQTFDLYNQLDTRTSSGVTIDYNFSSEGTFDSLINGNGVVTDYSYDELNRLELISQDYQGTEAATANTNTGFDYDVHDNVTVVTDARGNKTTYHYDDLGNLIKLESPDTGETNYVYDTAGNMTQKTDAKGIVIVTGYDNRNRVISMDYADDSLDVGYIYDQGKNGIGKISSMTDQTGTTIFSYDSFGNLEEKAQSITGFNASTYTAFNNLTTSYAYDYYNRLEKMTYPSGLELSYEYDALNQVNKISTVVDGQAVTVVDQVQYLPFGAIKSINYGNSKNFNANFDNGYRLEDYSYGAELTGLSFDNNNNILSLRNKSFKYDNLDRLTEHNNTYLHKKIFYDYDKLGNRISKNVACAHTSPDPCLDWAGYVNNPNNNQLGQIIEQNGSKSLNYDDNGNYEGDSTNEILTYNQTDRLSQFNIDGELRGEYYYNSFGQRVRKTQYKTNGDLAGEFLFVYDEQGQLIHISKYKNGQHIWDRENIWLGDRPVARIETRYNGANVQSQTIYYIQTDHLNTPRWITNDTGVRIWSWESDAFGSTAPNMDVDGDGISFWFNMRFPGQYLDGESGLHYNYYRDYDPKTGRYIQSDPIGLNAGWNTYVYVDSNPLVNIDPKGLVKYFWTRCNKKQKEECQAICEIQGKQMESCRIRTIARKNLGNLTNTYIPPTALSCSCTESFCEGNVTTCAVVVATGVAIIGLVKTLGKACGALAGVGS